VDGAAFDFIAPKEAVAMDAVFKMKHVGREEKLAEIKSKLDLGGQLDVLDLFLLSILPMCGMSNTFDKSCLMECIALSDKFFDGNH
jgi:hypothetical protein